MVISFRQDVFNHLQILKLKHILHEKVELALKDKMELNIHYFKILHHSKHIIPLKNAKFVQIPERKKN